MEDDNGMGSNETGQVSADSRLFIDVNFFMALFSQHLGVIQEFLTKLSLSPTSGCSAEASRMLKHLMQVREMGLSLNEKALPNASFDNETELKLKRWATGLAQEEYLDWADEEGFECIEEGSVFELPGPMSRDEEDSAGGSAGNGLALLAEVSSATPESSSENKPEDSSFDCKSVGGNVQPRSWNDVNPETDDFSSTSEDHARDDFTLTKKQLAYSPNSDGSFPNLAQQGNTVNESINITQDTSIEATATDATPTENETNGRLQAIRPRTEPKAKSPGCANQEGHEGGSQGDVITSSNHPSDSLIGDNKSDRATHLAKSRASDEDAQEVHPKDPNSDASEDDNSEENSDKGLQRCLPSQTNSQGSEATVSRPSRQKALEAMDKMKSMAANGKVTTNVRSKARGKSAHQPRKKKLDTINPSEESRAKRLRRESPNNGTAEDDSGDNGDDLSISSGNGRQQGDEVDSSSNDDESTSSAKQPAANPSPDSVSSKDTSDSEEAGEDEDNNDGDGISDTAGRVPLDTSFATTEFHTPRNSLSTTPHKNPHKTPSNEEVSSSGLGASNKDGDESNAGANKRDGCQNAIGDESDSQSSRTNENANEQGANEPEGEDFSGSGLIVQHCRDLSGEVKEGGAEPLSQRGEADSAESQSDAQNNAGEDLPETSLISLECSVVSDELSRRWAERDDDTSYLAAKVPLFQKLEVEIKDLIENNQLSRIPELANNTSQALTGLSTTSKLLGLRYSLKAQKLTSMPNFNSTNTLARVCKQFDKRGQKGTRANNESEEVVSNEEPHEVKQGLLKAKQAIHRLKNNCDAAQVDFDAAISDKALEKLIPFGLTEGNITNHMYHLRLMYSFLSETHLRRFYRNLKNAEFINRALTLAHQVNPNIVIDERLTLLNFHELHLIPGMRMEKTRLLAAKVACDIRLLITDTQNDPQRKEFLRSKWKRADTTTIDGGQDEGGDPPCNESEAGIISEGGGEGDKLYCSNDIDVIKRVTNTWFSLILGEAMEGIVPGDFFSELGYIPTLLRLSASQMGDMNGCNFMNHAFFEGKDPDKIEFAKEKIVAVALSKRQVKNRVVFVQDAEQLVCVKRLLSTVNPVESLEECNDRRVDFSSAELAASSKQDHSGRVNRSPIMDPLQLNDLGGDDLSSGPTVFGKIDHFENLNKENRLNICRREIEISPTKPEPKKTVQEKSLTELTLKTNDGQSSAPPQECQQS